MKKTVIALDVDGVLLPLTPLEELKLQRGSWDADEYALGGEEFYNFPFARPVVEFFRSLSTSVDVEVLWHTSWRQNAQEKLAPALNLPRFELLPSEQEYRAVDGEWWKLAAMKKFLESNVDVEIIWIDDDLSDAIASGEIDDSLQTHPRLKMFSPNLLLGLTPADLDLVESWLGG